MLTAEDVKQGNQLGHVDSGLKFPGSMELLSLLAGRTANSAEVNVGATGREREAKSSSHTCC